MKAIILVAGYGTRLYPLTKNKPKALLDVAGKPIIDYIVEQINDINSNFSNLINEIILVSNDKFYQNFVDWENNQKVTKTKISIINDLTKTEDTRLGAIGDINLAIEEFQIKEDIIVIAGDNLFTFSYVDLISFYTKHSVDCVCAKQIGDINLLKRFAVAKLEDNKIIDLVEKPENPESDIAVYATYVYKKETLPLVKKYIDDDTTNNDAPGYFIQWLYKQKPVFAYKFNGECFDVGTIESYNEVQEIFK